MIARTELQDRPGYFHLDEDVEAMGNFLPRGIIWDLASKPPWIRWAGYRADDERTMKASLLHDWIYLSHKYTRKEADRLYREQAIRDGLPRRKAWLEWMAIRTFGGPHWANDDEDKKLINRMIENWKAMGGKYLTFAAEFIY